MTVKCIDFDKAKHSHVKKSVRDIFGGEWCTINGYSVSHLIINRRIIANLYDDCIDVNSIGCSEEAKLVELMMTL